MASPIIPPEKPQVTFYTFDANSPPQHPAAGDAYWDPHSQEMVVWDSGRWIRHSLSSYSESHWHLFIDNELDPCDALMDNPTTVTVRTTEDAIRLLDAKGLPNSISFDHDLGDGLPAIHILWHIIHGHQDGKWDIRNITYAQLHSSNITAANGILQLWNSFSLSDGTGLKMSIAPTVKR
jgi:hypothetical protein